MGPGREQTALVALLRARPAGRSWPQITEEVIASGSAAAVWQRTIPQPLLTVPGQPDLLADAAASISCWQQQGLIVLTVLDADYPARLRAVHQAPPVLFGRGRLVPDELAVSVVGSRQASERGLQVAGQIAATLSGQGITVLSGLAAGIDTAAHHGALATGGRTVAVLGTGIDRVYPATNAGLHAHIGASGLLLSQFWPAAPPQKHTFLLRNATMSGYGLATVVVEAGEHSGARAQARIAVEHGRPVILTDLVLTATRWAPELLGRPGVYPAATLAQVSDIVTGLAHAATAAADGVDGLPGLVYA